MILQKTVELIKKIYRNYEVTPPKINKVVIGLGYTGVEVSAYGLKPILGLASTLSSVIKSEDCTKINFAGKLSKMNVLELLEWSYFTPSLKKIIGIATLNALSQHIIRIRNPYSMLTEDITNLLEIGQDTRITMIGLMKPLIRKLSKKTMNITLVEDTISVPSEFNKFKIYTNINLSKNEDIPPNILICTGTTLINDTIEMILNLFKDNSLKTVLIGPTASLLPDILFEYGVNIVGGIEIIDSEATLKVLQEGGGTKIFKKFGKKYNLIKK